MKTRVFATVVLSATMISTFAPMCRAQEKPSLAAPSGESANQKIATDAKTLQPIIGDWAGALDVGAKLPLVLHIKSESGAALVSLDSPDQGAFGLPVSAISLRDQTLKFEMKVIQASFAGTLNKDATEMSGDWTQGGRTFPLIFKRATKSVRTTPERPQEPKKPYPYNEKEVTYENKAAGTTLAGTLTTPRGQGPFPVVLLITGSGPQDRDETLFGHKPFLVLADYLTRRGVAVLRVDDRGVGNSTGQFNGATSEDFAGDALAGVAYLKTCREIDPKRIGLVGHSEGGLIAPMVADKSSDVAFLVLLAGPGLPGDELLLLQQAAIARTSGADEARIAKSRMIFEPLFTLVKREKGAPDLDKKMRALLTELAAKWTQEEKVALGLTPEGVDGLVKVFSDPWFQYFLAYDPRPTLRRVKSPVLAVNGERDVQVPPKENLSVIAKALNEGGNKRCKTVELPKLNHLFQTSETGAPIEYAKITETLSPSALTIVSDWILEQTTDKRSDGKVR